jgi:hypothetical protein
LNYYNREDAPLFTGREKDVKSCAYVLARRGTRIMFLHGRTGCGKSSFLRAGLIPFLEDSRRGFHFLKKPERGQMKALFVRSTSVPLLRLAETVFDFASVEHDLETPDGLERLSLKNALPQEAGEDSTRFSRLVQREPQVLAEVLTRLASQHPRTLVLVLDQAEEVLTLNPRLEEHPAQSGFFEFMASLSQSNIDLRLVVTLRTEFFGQFRDEVRRRSKNLKLSALEDYLLRELDGDELVHAIKLPTCREEIIPYGSPFDQYGFEFEDDLPERIVRDLMTFAPGGGALPILQIVCDRLYRDRERSAAVSIIKREDYQRLGGIEGQVGRHLDEILTRWFEGQGLDWAACQREVEYWKEALFQLVQTQPDGTVTTKLATKGELEVVARQSGCNTMLIQATIDHLEVETQRILRRAELYSLEHAASITVYSLGHDAIGLALRKWRFIKEGADKQRALARWAVRSTAALYLIMGSVTLIWELLRPHTESTHTLLVFGGILLTFGLGVMLYPKPMVVLMERMRLGIARAIARGNAKRKTREPPG